MARMRLKVHKYKHNPVVKAILHKCSMIQLKSQVTCGKAYCQIGEAKSCGGFCPRNKSDFGGKKGEFGKIMIIPIVGHKKFYQPSEIYMENYEKAMEKKRKKERAMKREVAFKKQEAIRKHLKAEVVRLEKPAKQERKRKARHEVRHKELTKK